MNEIEWLKSSDPLELIRYLDSKSRVRKHLLYGCAECRRKWDHFSGDAVSIQNLELAERYADGEVEASELRNAKDAMYYGYVKGGSSITMFLLEIDSISPVEAVVSSILEELTNWALDNVGEDKTPEVIKEEELLQVQLVHDVFGNPFRKVKLNRKTLSSQAISIATAIYDDRAFNRLPILADALQESGVDNEDILNHLRSHGPHVRGCWALDLVLGKK